MEKPIRILHVLQRMEAGGTQALLMNIYRNIDRNKVQFDFLVEYPNKQFYDDEIIKMGGKIYYTNVRNDYNLFRYKKQLKDVLMKNDYKIIHVHAFTIGYITLKVAKECGVPVRIAHSHNNETVKDKKYYIKKIMQKLYTIHATDLFACSDEAGKYLFREKKYSVLKNAIDSSNFIFDANVRLRMREKLNITDKFVVGHVGRLHAQKNHKKLLDIFCELKKQMENAILLLIGEGPLEKDIKQLVKELNLENDVIFLGNRKDVNQLYQAMDVFVLPSLFEGLGIVAIEAQASGVPCVTSDMVSKETLITSLIKQEKLEDESSTWVKDIIEIAKSDLAKKNMQSYIINSGYDIKESAKKMEIYYLNKLEESEVKK